MSKSSPKRPVRPSPPLPGSRPRTPAPRLPRILATKKRPSVEPFTRPVGKPHGPAFVLRRRCLMCGYVVNDSRRFEWEHVPGSWNVVFGGRLPGGKGVITYTKVSDPEYLPIMRAAVLKVARQLGLSLRGPRKGIE